MQPTAVLTVLPRSSTIDADRDHASLTRGVDRALLPLTAQARAYGGPAHGRRWSVDPRATPPEAVELPLGAGRTAPYELVRHARTGLVLRDRHGRYLYLPVLRIEHDHPLAA